MAIIVKDLSIKYQNKEVLNPINFTIEDGSIVCFKGHSGSGKTSLIRILMGLLEGQQGQIIGLEDKGISAVFQEDRLCKNLSAVTNIHLVCDLSKSEIREELKYILPSDCLNQPIIELSGGMKRRVAIVRAMVVDSDVIFMDEPFKGLDKELKGKVIEYVLSKRNGRTLCVISHDEEDSILLKADEIIHIGDKEN